VFVQDLSQLKAVYPRWQSFLANTSQQFFGTADYDTARYLSGPLGQQTIHFETGGSSYSDPGIGKPASTSSSLGEHFQGRPLLTPDEIMRLGPTKPIILIAGEPPYLLDRVSYLTDPAMPVGSIQTRCTRPRRRRENQDGQAGIVVLPGSTVGHPIGHLGRGFARAPGWRGACSGAQIRGSHHGGSSSPSSGASSGAWSRMRKAAATSARAARFCKSSNPRRWPSPSEISATRSWLIDTCSSAAASLACVRMCSGTLSANPLIMVSYDSKLPIVVR
jgi:hypothetical protein